jgi:uncharacterized protein (TIGR04141 family)
VRDPPGARSSLEICDLLGPGNELIHVRRAKGSAPLSHPFSQGLVSAQNLVARAAPGPGTLYRHGRRPARRARSPGRLQAEEGRLRHLMENGRQLTPDTLFPFSQATLAHAARILGTYGIDVEVEVEAIPAA